MLNFEWIAESDWGYTSLAALHVLGIAWFGATVFTPALRRLQWVGVTLMVLTGSLLFASKPTRFTHSLAFRAKLGFFAAAIVFRNSQRISIPLWIAVITLGRFTPFF